MGILSRILRNISLKNKLNDKKYSEKAIKKHIDKLVLNLMDVKKEFDSILDEEKNSEALVNKCKKEIDDLQMYAVKAVQSGNDDDAKKFLQQKSLEEDKLIKLQEIYNIAHENSNNVRNIHDKLVFEINEFKLKLESIKDREIIVEMREKINNISTSSTNNPRDVLNQMKEEANVNFNKVNIRDELNKYSKTFEEDEKNTAIEEELNNIKFKLNNNKNI